jgi:hypothetical protein
MGVAGEMGPKGRKIWRTASTAMHQTTDLGKGQEFEAGFMGKSSNPKIPIHPALPRSFVGHSALPGGCGQPSQTHQHKKPRTALRPRSSPLGTLVRLAVVGQIALPQATVTPLVESSCASGWRVIVFPCDNDPEARTPSTNAGKVVLTPGTTTRSCNNCERRASLNYNVVLQEIKQ